MSILVTGGAGYIGSHTVVELIQSGKDAVVIDNLNNTSASVFDRIELITGRPVRRYIADVRDRAALNDIFEHEDIDCVIHFAGLKAVGESVRMPLEYYDNNIIGILALCEAMREHKVKKLLFSSSATVYGQPESVPIYEDSPRSAENPYGRTKLMIEHILEDLAKADPEWRIMLLRYFNPIGAHESGLIGEAPNGIPNNLTPYITQVITGRHAYVRVYGDDYDTADGTGVRDYIHVADLARGHCAALEYLSVMRESIDAVNLGTGRGYSVLEMISAFERASGQSIPYRVEGRRPGDIGMSYAATEKAERLLHWKAEYGLDRMCEDSVRWQRMNPNGYDR